MMLTMSNDAQQVIDLARELGVNLQPWQEALIANALEIDPTTGKYRRMEFMMPRRYQGFHRVVHLFHRVVHLSQLPSGRWRASVKHNGRRATATRPTKNEARQAAPNISRKPY